MTEAVEGSGSEQGKDYSQNTKEEKWQRYTN